MIGIIDANNFFVSCERVFRPDIQNKPVIVLSNNDGCVISRSNEVKSLGVPMGVPVFTVKELLERNQVTRFSSNFALYSDMSSRMMSILKFLTPRIEVYSIDEAFIDFSGVDDIGKQAQYIRQQIRKCVGIPTCIGIAPTKTLAKIANHLAKKDSMRNGVCVLDKDSDIDVVLRFLPVNEIWGVGKKTSEQLMRSGIKTGYSLKQANPCWIRKKFTVTIERIVHELNGVVCFQVAPELSTRQSIQITRSFSEKIQEFSVLREVVATYATKLAEKLRCNNLQTTNVVVYVSTSRYESAQRSYYNKIQINLPVATSGDYDLIKASTEGLASIFKRGYDYHKAGVIALDLRSENQEQLSLFDQFTQNSEKTKQLGAAFDKINKRYGSGTVHMAACGSTLSWKDKKTQKSPAYTASWSELPIVLAK